MLEIDESGWPVVVMTAGENMGMEDAEAWVTAMDRMLDRKESFPMVMINENTEQRSNPQAANLTAKWLKTNKPLMSTYCRATATVSASPEYHERYADMLEKQGEQIYGSPVKVFHT